MKITLGRDSIISALKRNQKVEITAIIATLMGADVETLDTLTDTTRATDAFYQKVFDLVDFTGVESETIEEDVSVETEEDVSVETEEDVAKEEADDGFNDVRKAIKKGKGKKALKLIKAHRENGSRGSVLKGLAHEAKAL